MQIKGEPSESPNEMFFFSMVHDGQRGFEQNLRMHWTDDEEEQDPSTLGIDWDVIEDRPLMNHHQLHNPQNYPPIPGGSEANPFHHTPPKLSEVLCESPNCPFNAEQIAVFNSEISRSINLTSRSMMVRRWVWIKALRIVGEVYLGNL